MKLGAIHSLKASFWMVLGSSRLFQINYDGGESR